MNPRDIAVFFEPLSPNQSRSFKKNPFGIPTRHMREAGPNPLPEARLKTASKTPMKESIIALEQMDGAVECVPAERIWPLTQRQTDRGRIAEPCGCATSRHTRSLVSTSTALPTNRTVLDRCAAGILPQESGARHGLQGASGSYRGDVQCSNKDCGS